MDNWQARTITIQRHFQAPISLVWEAWTTADHIVKWWSPAGTPTKIIQHDFRVGGAWKYEMLMPNDQTFIANGIYKEIVSQQKIISSANFLPMTEGVEIHALFEADGETTNFTFHIVHPTASYKIEQEKLGILNGWGSVFDRLETLLQPS